MAAFYLRAANPSCRRFIDNAFHRLTEYPLLDRAVVTLSVCCVEMSLNSYLSVGNGWKNNQRFQEILMTIILLPFMLAAFFGGLLLSVLVLSMAWRMAPVCNSPFGVTANAIVCFLGIVLGVFLWISVFLPWLKGVSEWDWILLILLDLSLIGATPLAAFPAILLYGAGRKSRKPQ